MGCALARCCVMWNGLVGGGAWWRKSRSGESAIWSAVGRALVSYGPVGEVWQGKDFFLVGGLVRQHMVRLAELRSAQVRSVVRCGDVGSGKFWYVMVGGWARCGGLRSATVRSEVCCG